MLIIPAIDLKDGQVVRLLQGKLSDKTVYSKDPLKTARHWAKQGARLIHVVDLDGATSGRPKNLGVAKEIAGNVRVPVEFGGGVRDLKTIKELLGAGIFRVVLGTAAARDKKFLLQARKQFKDRVIVSIDARGGKVAIKGWQENLADVKAQDLALELKGTGFKEIIFTDIAKDGTLQGPNIKSIKMMLRLTGMKVIASGGISSLDDIRKLKLMEKDGVTGIIVGKALYEGRFTLSEAMKIT